MRVKHVDGSLLLALGNIFPTGIDLFERRYLAILFYKLNDHVGKLPQFGEPLATSIRALSGSR